MSKVPTLEGIGKIYNIILSNQNKINLLRNDISNNLINDNCSKIKTQQFLNSIEIDLKNILSLLERIKNDLNNNNQNGNYKTYCINNDNNQDILICGCCHCCKCCECSTNNCSYDHPLNISYDKNEKKNEYIKERINFDDDKHNEILNVNNINTTPDFKVKPPNSNIKNNNYTFPNSNLDDNYNNSKYPNLNSDDNYNSSISKDYSNRNTLNINKEKDLNQNNDENLIYSQFPSFGQQNNNINNYQNQLQKPFGYIKRQPFINNMDSDDNNLPIEEKIKNSAIIKSKRFHGSKSFDNIEGPSSRKKGRIITSKNKNNIGSFGNNYINNNDNNFDNYNLNKIFKDNMPNNNKIKNIDNIFNNKIDDKNKNLNIDDNDDNNDNIYNNLLNKDNENLSQKRIKMEKMNKIQKFLNKLYKQPEEVVNRLKKMFGNDMEEKLLSGEINNEKLNEMNNILDKIVKMSIWGEDEKVKKKKVDLSNSSDKKRKINFIYNPIQEKIKLMKSMKNNQAYYREFPRGWYSTKEYFINNGTDINNENINKYV